MSDSEYADDMGFGHCKECGAVYPYDGIADSVHVCIESSNEPH